MQDINKEQEIQRLKALAYDQIATMEGCSKNLQAINNELQRLQQPPVVEPEAEPAEENSDEEPK